MSRAGIGNRLCSRNTLKQRSSKIRRSNGDVTDKTSSIGGIYKAIASYSLAQIAILCANWRNALKWHFECVPWRTAHVPDVHGSSFRVYGPGRAQNVCVRPRAYGSLVFPVAVARHV